MPRPTIADISAGARLRLLDQLAASQPERKRKRAHTVRRESPDATAFFVAAGLPAPLREFKFHLWRRWRFDYAWPNYMVALEVEGGAWSGGRHTRGAGFLGDIEKYNEAAAGGWYVLRCIPRTLRTAATAELVARTMLRATAKLTTRAEVRP